MAVDEECRVHGAQLVLADASIAQVLGLPSPPGLIPVIPKYEPCRRPTPWRGRSGGYCRVTRSYGPRGVEAGIAASSLRGRWDPQYSTVMPYVEEHHVYRCLEPRRALAEAVAKGEVEVVNVVDELASLGVRSSCLGLTGSRALGIAHGDSDVDLVAYGCEEDLYEIFSGLASDWGQPQLGGIHAAPSPGSSWRRAVIRGSKTTWIPARNRCPPLRSYWAIDPPLQRAILELDVDPGQPWSLGYPPCALSRQGTWIVSYEFNLAGILYRGGRMRVEGLASRDYRVVYLGLREEPGTLLCLCADT